MAAIRNAKQNFIFNKIDVGNEILFRFRTVTKTPAWNILHREENNLVDLKMKSFFDLW